MEITIDLKELSKFIKDFDNFSKYTKYIVKNTINDIGFDIMRGYRKEIATKLEIKRKAIIKSIYLRKATIQNLTAEITNDYLSGSSQGGKRWVARLLYPHVYGGARDLKGFEYAAYQLGFINDHEKLIPTGNVKINYNLLLSQLRMEYKAGYSFNARRKKSRATYFFVSSYAKKLSPGIYVRKGRKLVKVMHVVSEPMYMKVLNFRHITDRIMNEKTEFYYRKNLKWAIEKYMK